MNFYNANIIITGSSGDLGSKIISFLDKENSNLILLDKNPPIKSSKSHDYYRCDLSKVADIEQVCKKIDLKYKNIDIIINLAGVIEFNNFVNELNEKTELLFKINFLSAAYLTKYFLKGMMSKNSGIIVNIGSVFGSIAFPGFVSYSASKYALRGFSEALRRELCDTNIKVLYIAPRAIKTKFNSGKINIFNDATKSKSDSIHYVSKIIIDSIKNKHKEKYIGYPEKIFVKINSIFPRIVDIFLKNLPKIINKILNN
ncbi:MAG: SDR family NAD(P)-dependent oxidoreductase [Gammaproteobacteria bacterium]|jgi:short-subunit dehydrogenase|nr:SDR family NAD(P)-dependent oxidoreductase [Gammaproteobacteria bacterium]MBT7076935.1 SDR family NAD(P)-dependent oxidoreductase [Pelagibacterales bacterium]MBT7322340.1 SDR family NAD(P)-dependent oxidoreductase [Gammaproteobacteria bacterium]MBT7931895.1 SDR family NAD(P)-dependent oxidoreductase [Gammaproteobacteria bacterium]|tara:strand:+ start:734 stop:1504 length:771 start_codon:yes stop_codon:yes gene_type:complete